MKLVLECAKPYYNENQERKQTSVPERPAAFGDASLPRADACCGDPTRCDLLGFEDSLASAEASCRARGLPGITNDGNGNMEPNPAWRVSVMATSATKYLNEIPNKNRDLRKLSHPPTPDRYLARNEERQKFCGYGLVRGVESDRKEQYG